MKFITPILYALLSLPLLAAPALPQRGTVVEFDTITALLATSPEQLTKTYVVKGLTAVDDGYAGKFYYIAGDVSDTNQFNCFEWGTGRLKRSYDAIHSTRIENNGSSTNYMNQLWAQGTVHDIRGLGVACDGVTDDTVAWQAAINAVGANSVLFVPIGTTTLITGTLTITNDRVHIRGGGSWTGKFIFSPTSDDIPLFHVERTGQQVFQGSISGITLGKGNARPKIGIKLVDVGEYFLSDVILNDWHGGGTSICVQTFGRELFRTYDNCRWTGDIPLYIGKNPNTAPDGYLSADHFSFYDLFLSSGTTLTQPLIVIQDGVHLSSTAFVNCSFNGGTHGLYWNDTSATATSEGLTFFNSRFEQGVDTNYYSIYISMKGSDDGGANLQNLNLIQTTLDGDRNGIYMRKVTSAMMKGGVYPGAHQFVNLVCKPSNTTFGWENVTFLNGLVDGLWRPLVTMYGMKEKMRVGKMGSNDPLPPTAYFEAMGTTNQAYIAGQNWQGTGNSLAVMNSVEATSGVVESLSVAALGDSGITSGFGPGIALKSHNDANGVATNAVISSVWNSSVAGSERAQVDIKPMSTNGPTSLLTIRGDGRVLFPGAFIQVDDSGTPINIGASSGLSWESGSVWPNLYRNQTHGGMEFRTWTGSDYIASLHIDGGTRDIHLGETLYTLPRLYFWADDTGAYLQGLGQGLFGDMKLGNLLMTNIGLSYFTHNSTSGMTIEGSTGSAPGRALTILDNSDSPLMVVTNNGAVAVKTSLTVPILNGGNVTGANTAATNIVIQGGAGTGTGKGGNVYVQTADTESAGSTANPYITRQFFYADHKDLTAGVATTIATIALPDGDNLAVEVFALTSAGDAGGERQSVADTFLVAASNKAGTITVNASTPVSVAGNSSGTLTPTWSVAQNGAAIVIQNSAVSSLTETFLRCRWQIRINSSDVATVTPEP